VITSEPSNKRAELDAESSEAYEANKQAESPKTDNQSPQITYNTPNFMLNSQLLASKPDNCGPTELIPNWYNYYPLQNQHQYFSAAHSSVQPLNGYQVYDQSGYPSYPSPYPPPAYNSIYNLRSDFSPYPQLPKAQSYQQSSENWLVGPNGGYQYDYVPSEPVNQSERKQSSPIYEVYGGGKLLSSKRTHKDSRSAPYATTRPIAKKTNNNTSPTSNNDLLDSSPVGGFNIAVSTNNNNDQSDDSLNSTENYLSQLPNQTLQNSNTSSNTSSSNNTTSSSFFLSSSSASA
jgi:hypothetical protein